jgi:hypothetical protein
MLNFSVTVIKKLLKALATFVGSLSFSLFTSNVVTFYTERLWGPPSLISNGTWSFYPVGKVVRA